MSEQLNNLPPNVILCSISLPLHFVTFPSPTPTQIHFRFQPHRNCLFSAHCALPCFWGLHTLFQWFRHLSAHPFPIWKCLLLFKASPKLSYPKLFIPCKSSCIYPITVLVCVHCFCSFLHLTVDFLFCKGKDCVLLIFASQRASNCQRRQYSTAFESKD